MSEPVSPAVESLVTAPFLSLVMPAPEDDPVGWRCRIEDRLSPLLALLGASISGGGTMFSDPIEADIGITGEVGAAFEVLVLALDSDDGIPVGSCLTAYGGPDDGREWVKERPVGPR